MHEKQVFVYAHVFSHGDMVHAELRAECGRVDELPAMFGKYAQQPWHHAQLLDPDDVADIPLDDRLDVVEMPIAPPSPPETGQRLGVAAREYRLHKVIADDRGSGFQRPSCKRLVEKGCGRALQLCLGQGQQADDPHAVGERIGDARQCHQVGRAGEKESPGARVGVHGRLDDKDKTRGSADLVDNRPVDVANKANRIGRCSIQNSGVVEREERDGIVCDLPRQRGLAGLPGPQSGTTLVSAVASWIRFPTKRGPMVPGFRNADGLKDERRPIESREPTN